MARDLSPAGRKNQKNRFDQRVQKLFSIVLPIRYNCDNKVYRKFDVRDD